MAGQVESLHEASRARPSGTCVVLEQQLTVFFQHRRKRACGVDARWLLLVSIRAQAIDKMHHVTDFAELLEIEYLIVLSQQVWQTAVAGLGCCR